MHTPAVSLRQARTLPWRRLALGVFLAVLGCSANHHEPEIAHTSSEPAPVTGSEDAGDSAASDALDAGASAGSDEATSMDDAGGDAAVQSSFAGFYDHEQGVPLIALLDSATRSIDIEIYEMLDRSVHEAVRRALARGVRVRVVQEPAPVGDGCSPFDPAKSGDDLGCTSAKKLFANIKAAGGSYEPFDKKVLCKESYCVQHGKLVIVDGAEALLSTGNFNGTNLCDAAEKPKTCNRDYSVITDDRQVVDTLAQVFAADLAHMSYDLGAVLDAGGARARLTVSPLSEAPLIAFIRSAQRSIRIENQYLHHPALNDALVERAKAGVEVRVTVASFCSFGRPDSGDKTKETAIYKAFDAAGIHTRVFNGKVQVLGHPGYLHAKAIVVDDTRAWVGSVNGSTAGMSANREFGLFFERSEWVSALVSSLAQNHDAKDTESWQESLACAKDPM